MGKASSAKKVARAARAGGRRSSAGRQRNLLFPGVIGAIVLLGSALVWFAADERKSDSDVPPVIGDHWHAAYGIYVCGEWQPDIPEFEATTGIHTRRFGVRSNRAAAAARCPRTGSVDAMSATRRSTASATRPSTTPGRWSAATSATSRRTSPCSATRAGPRPPPPTG